MQHVDVGNGVSASWVFNDQVVDVDMLALLKADSEIRFRQRAEVVADLGAFPCHVDNHGTVGKLPEILVLFGLQHTHETEVLRRDFVVKVALQDGVRHLVAKDNEPASANAKQGFHTAFYILVYALVVFVEDDQHRVDPLEIGHLGYRLLREKLLEGTLKGSVSEIGRNFHAANLGKIYEIGGFFHKKTLILHFYYCKCILDAIEF